MADQIQSPTDPNTLPVVPQVPGELIRTGGQQTAKRAIKILLASGEGFHEPTGKERRALLVAFAKTGKVLYGAAFDVVRSDRPINFGDVDDITRNLEHLTIYEIKSTNQAAIAADFVGYFFNLSTAELLVAQSLGPKFKFAFVNICSETYTELGLQDVFGRARGIYPTWSIKF